jgi:superfamily II DNA or RNA helicase
MTSTYLGSKGYSIYKECLTIEEQECIRRELTVKAFAPKSCIQQPIPFPIYRESIKKFYVPRFYGIDAYGDPDENRLPNGKKINLKFKGGLRDIQKPIVSKYLKHAKINGCGLIEIYYGAGKTVMALNILAHIKRKTLIVVHKDFLLRQWKERIEQFLPGAKVGKIQADIMDIEGKDIVIGMLQSLSMKEYPPSIFQEFGFTIIDECFPYETHIHTNKGLIRIGSLYEKWINKEELPEILSFNQLTKKFEYKKMTYSWRKEREDLIKIKMSKKVINCTPEHKILTTKGYIEANKLKEGDLIVSKYDTNHIDNIIAPALNNDQLQIVYASYLGDGHIDITKQNRYRLKFTHCEKQKEYCKWKSKMFNITKLKYIEKNGYGKKPAYSFHTKIFDLENKITKNTKLVPDWLLDKLDARGIAIWYMDDGSISKRECKNHVNNYISIHSNNFNYETQEKFVKKFNQYGIQCSIHKTRNKYYYLNFNKENTIKLLQLINPYIHDSMKYKLVERDEQYDWNNTFLNYGTLKVSQISYFKNKGANRCKKPYVYDIEVEDNHNFIIGSKTNNKQVNYIDGPVVSNCHHISAEVFSRSLFKIVTKYMLGLSATMTRKDGLTKVFKQFIGPVVVKKERPLQDNVVVKAIEYTNDDEGFSKVALNFRGHTNYTIMIKKLCEFNRRSEFILKVLKDLLKNDRPDLQIMIIGHNKSLLKYLYDAVEHRKIAPVGYYIGGMKEKDLKESEGKKIIIATYAMAEEALDIKTLSALLMATPRVDVRQAVGRILRNVDGEKLVVDIIDQHNIFQKHWCKRRAWYKKQKFKIMKTDLEGYEKDEWEEINNKRSRKTNKSKSQSIIVDPMNLFLTGKCLID